MQGRLKTYSKQTAITTVLLLALILAGPGCQSFTMTQAEFQRQQAGHDVDPAVGSAVGTVGTAAYFGAALGSILAGVK